MSKNPDVHLDHHHATDLLLDQDVLYPVMEHFYTIQGEGVHSGKAAYFIRLAGCDVGCPWCDVKESWDGSKHPKLACSFLVQSVLEAGAKTVVITGGEPLLHDLFALTGALRAHNINVHIETSGSSAMTGVFDWVTLSPKRYKPPVSSIYSQVDELKVVILAERDFRWAEQHAALCSEHTTLLLQPEWDTPSSLPLIIEYSKKHPQWRISLQTHKYMDIP